MVPNAQPSNNNIALGQFVRDVVDFPKPGILFRDITPLLGDACAMSSAIEQLLAPWRETEIDRIAAVEARGFLFAAPMATRLSRTHSDSQTRKTALRHDLPRVCVGVWN